MEIALNASPLQSKTVDCVYIWHVQEVPWLTCDNLLVKWKQTFVSPWSRAAEFTHVGYRCVLVVPRSACNLCISFTFKQSESPQLHQIEGLSDGWSNPCASHAAIGIVAQALGLDLLVSPMQHVTLGKKGNETGENSAENRRKRSRAAPGNHGYACKIGRACCR